MLYARSLLLVSLLSTGFCYGQGTVGQITGSITDQCGAALPGTRIVAVESATKVRTQTIAQGNGSYVFASLKTGDYALSVEREGFTTITNTGIVLDAASSRSVDFVLRPTFLTDSVSVEAAAKKATSIPLRIQYVEPTFTEEARRSLRGTDFHGTVLVTMTIDEEGCPRDLRVLRGLGLGLDENALDSVKNWRFRPGLNQGKPVPMKATVEVNFGLLARPPQGKK